jgi:hypothetical protein
VALLSDNHVKLYSLPITDTANSFTGVVTRDSSLMDEDVFLGVIAVDETISTLNVEPLNNARYFSGNNLLLRCSLWLFWLFLRVGHGVSSGKDVKLTLHTRW